MGEFEVAIREKNMRAYPILQMVMNRTHFQGHQALTWKVGRADLQQIALIKQAHLQIPLLGIPVDRDRSFRFVVTEVIAGLNEQS